MWVLRLSVIFGIGEGRFSAGYLLPLTVAVRYVQGQDSVILAGDADLVLTTRRQVSELGVPVPQGAGYFPDSISCLS